MLGSMIWTSLDLMYAMRGDRRLNRGRFCNPVNKGCCNRNSIAALTSNYLGVLLEAYIQISRDFKRLTGG
jgi:hypothetical protein